MKKAFKILTVSFILLTGVNLYVLYINSDADTFRFAPTAPLEKKLIVATFSNGGGLTLHLQWFYWRDDYKYLYFQPIKLSEEFTINCPNKLREKMSINNLQLYFKNRKNELKRIGAANDFYLIAEIPQELIIQGRLDTISFKLDTIYEKNKNKPSYFFDQFTLGPICELYK